MLEHNVNKFKLYVDGAARNNPGPAGAGIYIEKNKKVIYTHGFYLGNKTNNQAEYLALVLGLYYAKKFLNNEDLIEIVSDSELLVRQVSGIYKIKNEELKKLHFLTMSILKKIKYTIGYIPREKNVKADKNANVAIDKKIPLEQDLINFLKQYEIYP